MSAQYWLRNRTPRRTRRESHAQILQQFICNLVLANFNPGSQVCQYALRQRGWLRLSYSLSLSWLMIQVMISTRSKWWERTYSIVHTWFLWHCVVVVGLCVMMVCLSADEKAFNTFSSWCKVSRSTKAARPLLTFLLHLGISTAWRVWPTPFRTSHREWNTSHPPRNTPIHTHTSD